MSVVAVDTAGNESAATTVSWELDATAPAPQPVVTGLPGALTNEKAFTLTASGSTDKNSVTYRWTFNGQTATGNTFDVATTTDGTYSVSVVAVDTAGNESAATTVSWELDTTAPAPVPVVAGLPGALTNQKTFTLTASGSTDKNGVTYRWTFSGQTATGNTFDVATTTDGDYSVSVVAVDDAGNESAATTVNWTLDTVAPADLAISGDPVAGSVVKTTAFDLTAFATDATVLTFSWTLNGDAVEGNTTSNYVGTAVEGTNTVTVMATDAAGNVSAQPATHIWVVDTIAPTTPEISGKPEKLTNQGEFGMTATSTDATRLTYHWRLNGGEESTLNEGEAFADTVSEGDYTVSVYAEDEAGNFSQPATYSWTYDVTAPSMPEFTSKPREFTNENSYEFVVTSKDNVSAVSYCWSTNNVEFTDGVATLTEGVATLTGETNEEGEYTVWVYSKDVAGNVSQTNSWTWTYDVTAPTVVKFDSDTPAYFKEGMMLTMKVEFSEVVTNFTAESLMVSNGKNVTVTAVEGSTTNYVVTVEPIEDGEVSVQIPAGVVADYAGNLNEASGTLTRTYDTTAPKVTLSSATPEQPELLNIAAMPFEVTVTFDEVVTNFTAQALTVENGKVVEFTESQEPDKTNKVFTVTITNADELVTSISVSIAAGTVTDLAGNGNDASNVLTRNCDVMRPTIEFDGARTNNSARVTIKVLFSDNATNFLDNLSFTKDSVSVSNCTVEVRDIDRVNGTCQIVITPIEGDVMTFEIEENVVTDPAGNGNKAFPKMIFTLRDDHWDWEYEESETPPEPTSVDVEFGKGVCVKVDSKTGVTNSVRFTAIGFKPGDVSTFTMSGFAPSTLKEPEEFHMWFVVCDSLGGEVEYKAVDFVKFESGELTVTLPAEATQNKDALFIIGIDNSDNSGN